MLEVLHHRLVQVVKQDRHRSSGKFRHGYEFLFEVLTQPLEYLIIKFLQPSDRAPLQTQFEKLIELFVKRRHIDDQQFGCRQSIELVEKLLVAIVARIEIVKAFARRDIRTRQRDLLTRFDHQRNVIVDGVVQSVIGQNGTGGYDFDHGTVGQPLLFRIADLFDDRHLITLGNEFLYVRITCVMGHAAHGGAAPLSKCQAKFACADLCVVIEHLIKVSEVEEQECVLVLLLRLEVLLHHWCYCHASPLLR